MITVGIAGAAGKMGRALVRAVAEQGQFKLASAWERPGESHVGQDAGLVAGINSLGVPIAAAPAPGACQVVIDFTAPEATLALLDAGLSRECALVVGTTGLTPEQLDQLRAAGRSRPVVYATNYSLGVNLLWALARQAAAVLGPAFNAEIIEAHHNQKKDAPSGTAVTLLEAICHGRGLDPKRHAVYGREGLVGPRPQDEVGVHAVRGGDIVGDHIALFAGPGERLELRHQLHSRDTLARGAVRAAAWIHGQPPGFYGMAEVLGLEKA
ncbi:MAG: 4-hydroxy-tetrahydrodipicolinate reductase [candidate division FCPU426 bacterium]